MTRTSHLVLAITGMLALVGPQAALAETLQEAFVAAYQTSPVLDAQRADLRATDEGVSQALSGWRPSVSVTGELASEHRNRDNSRSDTFNPKSADLTATQPLYRGGRTVAGTQAAEESVLAGRAELQSSEQTVFFDVVRAFMDVLRDEAVVQLTGNNERVLMRHLDAANDRFRVGEVTRTDVAQSEARLARAVSERVEAEGGLESSRATYVRVVGHAPVELQPPPPVKGLPKSKDESITVALDENPDLESAIHNEASSRHTIRTVSGELLPTVALEGEINQADDQISSNDGTDGRRIAVQVSVPLYQSGSVYSRVREARQVNNLRRVQIEDARRSVREIASQAWDAFVTSQAKIKANREQVRANQVALEGVEQEAQVGSRTTLDVLDAEQELLDSQVALVQDERDEYVAAMGLLLAVGRLTVEDMQLPVESYDPTANYRRVRNKWFGTDGGLD